MQELAKAIKNCLDAQKILRECERWAKDVSRPGTDGGCTLSVRCTGLQLVKETTNQRPSCTLRAPSEFSREALDLLFSDLEFIDKVLCNLHLKVVEAHTKVQAEAARVLKELQDAV